MNANVKNEIMDETTKRNLMKVWGGGSTRPNNYLKVLERDGLGSMIHHLAFFDDSDVGSILAATAECSAFIASYGGKCSVAIYHRLDEKVEKALLEAAADSFVPSLRCVVPCDSGPRTREHVSAKSDSGQDTLICKYCGRVSV